MEVNLQGVGNGLARDVKELERSWRGFGKELERSWKGVRKELERSWK